MEQLASFNIKVETGISTYLTIDIPVYDITATGNYEQLRNLGKELFMVTGIKAEVEKAQINAIFKKVETITYVPESADPDIIAGIRKAGYKDVKIESNTYQIRIDDPTGTGFLKIRIPKFPFSDQYTINRIKELFTEYVK